MKRSTRMNDETRLLFMFKSCLLTVYVRLFDTPDTVQREVTLWINHHFKLLGSSPRAGFLPCPLQSRARHPPALVLHHHLQRGQALHEEQAAGEGTAAQSVSLLTPSTLSLSLSLCSDSPPPQVFVHGDELDNYMKEFDADILPADFDGKAPVTDCQAIATKLFGSEDTAL